MLLLIVSFLRFFFLYILKCLSFVPVCRFKLYITHFDNNGSLSAVFLWKLLLLQMTLGNIINTYVHVQKNIFHLSIRHLYLNIFQL